MERAQFMGQEKYKPVNALSIYLRKSMIYLIVQLIKITEVNLQHSALKQRTKHNGLEKYSKKQFWSKLCDLYSSIFSEAKNKDGS